jgi:hypothetical protein
MTNQKREPRELENRAEAERPKRWMPPALLPDPEPEEGYAFRWIRLSTLNNPDPVNISTKLREGWEPVKASEQPKLRLLSNPNGRFPDGIEVGGLLLCKTPVEFTQQRDQYYQNQANTQMESVDNNYMRQSDPRMPVFKERSSKVTLGTSI